ncbi:hypothetical protein JVX98_12715 [Ensifer sp. PDNC004]|uniref:hypothetical protein n=1 Tax=Ensifer sp. PDNC004 TaxID=2811423 RepID=UPI001963E6FD|nr:hypothetical protein [Ensifer sp. PDNC004]QRY70347.1 hypothetical protein JVX98_12715 [Ensifer sp. PDNC004]
MSDEGTATRRSAEGPWVHLCEQPGCTKWGGWGFAIGKGSSNWFCYEHKPAVWPPAKTAYPMSDHKNLDQGIYIGLVTTREPIKRAFAGTGQSRRREKTSAAAIARSIVESILRNHRIERGGEPVDEAEIIDVLTEELWKVPEQTAKDLVGVDANKRDAAKAAITQALLAALLDRYDCTFFMPEYRSMGASTHKGR